MHMRWPSAEPCNPGIVSQEGAPMSKREPARSRRSRALGLDPWALRHRGGQAPMTAMAVDDSEREDKYLEHRIEIEHTHYTPTGARYRVTYLGKTLIESAR